MNALLDSAERLLSDGSPETVTISEVCRQAGVTTGAFYARFRDKEALFDALEARVYDDFAAASESALSPSPESSLRSVFERVITATADLYHRHRGAIRAIRMLALGDPDRARRVAMHNRRLLDRVTARLLEHRDEIARSPAEAAVSDVVVWVVAILRQQILFEELALEVPTDARATRLVDLAVCYLRCSGEVDDAC